MGGTLRWSEREYADWCKRTGQRPESTTTAAGKTEARRVVEAELRQRLENKFAALWRQAGGPMDYVRNLKFNAPDSGAEFDFAWPRLRMAVEINGGQWKKSGHSSGKGLERDARKGIAAQAKGWRLFVLTSSMVTAENVAELVRIAQAQEAQA
jgi:very-short-patch-repair endonuclease